MEQRSNAGALRLAERILSEARSDAEQIAAQSNAALQEQATALAKRKAELVSEYEKKRTKQVADLLDGANTRAAIDGRKAALNKKRKVIEKAFALTYERLLQLPAEERKQILKGMLLSETAGGETIAPSTVDRACLTELVAELSEKKLTLSEQDASVESGFLILAKSYEKDCSFASLLREVREGAETAVSTLLFH